MKSRVVLLLQGGEARWSLWRQARCEATHVEPLDTPCPTPPFAGNAPGTEVLLLLDVPDETYTRYPLQGRAWLPSTWWRLHRLYRALRRQRVGQDAGETLYALAHVSMASVHRIVIERRLDLPDTWSAYLARCLDAGLSIDAVRSLASAALDDWTARLTPSTRRSQPACYLLAVCARDTLHLVLVQRQVPVFARYCDATSVRARSQAALVQDTREHLVAAGLATGDLPVCEHRSDAPPGVGACHWRRLRRREFDASPRLDAWLMQRRLTVMQRNTALFVILSLVIVAGSSYQSLLQRTQRRDADAQQQQRLDAAATVRSALDALPVSDADVATVFTRLQAVSASSSAEPVPVLQGIAARLSRHPRLRVTAIHWRMDGGDDVASDASLAPIDVVLSGQVVGDGDLRERQGDVRALVQALRDLPHLLDVQLEHSPLGTVRTTHAHDASSADPRRFSVRLRLSRGTA